MTWMFEVYYPPPSDAAREERVAGIVTNCGGRLDFRESPETDGSRNICLTCEFVSEAQSEQAAAELRGAGEYVEGPYRYT